MEDFTCLYLASFEDAESSQATSQPSQPQHLLSPQSYQPSEQLAVIDDDRDPTIALYPTLYL